MSVSEDTNLAELLYCTPPPDRFPSLQPSFPALRPFPISQRSPPRPSPTFASLPISRRHLEGLALREAGERRPGAQPQHPKPPPPASYWGTWLSNYAGNAISYRRKIISTVPQDRWREGSVYLHLQSGPGAAEEIDWLPCAPDLGLASPPRPPGPRPALPDPAPSCSHLLRSLSACLSLRLFFPSTTSLQPQLTPPLPPPQPGLRPFPLPAPPAQNLLRSLLGRRADTRQIGIRERKGGKATRQPGNKGAIKAAPPATKGG
jgi:hypothetical protein